MSCVLHCKGRFMIQKQFVMFWFHLGTSLRKTLCEVFFFPCRTEERSRLLFSSSLSGVLLQDLLMLWFYWATRQMWITSQKDEDREWGEWWEEKQQGEERRDRRKKKTSGTHDSVSLVLGLSRSSVARGEKLLIHPVTDKASSPLSLFLRLIKSSYFARSLTKAFCLTLNLCRTWNASLSGHHCQVTEYRRQNH